MSVISSPGAAVMRVSGTAPVTVQSRPRVSPGPHSSVPSSSTPASMRHVYSAGVRSKLPAWSTARTSKWWSMAGSRLRYVSGLAHSTQNSPSGGSGSSGGSFGSGGSRSGSSGGTGGSGGASRRHSKVIAVSGSPFGPSLAVNSKTAVSLPVTAGGVEVSVVWGASRSGGVIGTASTGPQTTPRHWTASGRPGVTPSEWFPLARLPPPSMFRFGSSGSPGTGSSPASMPKFALLLAVLLRIVCRPTAIERPLSAFSLAVLSSI